MLMVCYNSKYYKYEVVFSITMNKYTEVDIKEVELHEMTGDVQTVGRNKNGSLKRKVLSTDELMKDAGTLGPVFWLVFGLFIVVLVGEILYIVLTPGCKPVSEMNWWNKGPLYQISDLVAFSDGLAGVEKKLDYISELGVKGLVLGPLHTIQVDQLDTLNLTEINPTQGTEAALVALLEKAHKKGISVVLDLTPNYLGASPWFRTGDLDDVMEKVTTAAAHWLRLGVDGIKISDLSHASMSPDWSKLQSAVQGDNTEDTKKRLLMGVVEGVSAAEVSQLITSSGVDLVLSDLLSSRTGGVEHIKDMNILHSQQRNVGWGLGAARLDQLSKQDLIRLYQLLLFTMPGTPVFTYEDEIGLQAQGGKMVWDIEKEPAEGAVEAERKKHVAMRKWFRSLSELRGKKPSLLNGDFYPLHSRASSLAFLRMWDQSERYITAVNWGAASERLSLTPEPTVGLVLPEKVKVKLSTDPSLEAESTVSLDRIILAPRRGVLLEYPACFFNRTPVSQS
ncbi:4F2 cell-surface antigen heavy chain-like isoform X1 [Thunnus albacares]|uniref:4F2 cell-surface antigen heavy chain-like isoform X1 n=2 Tax=Thunnus albacares TaxID=8236 RepID=UPI001CF63986|nr:4F2 cell-surface antigen heavy chain-like isoform X1 [Thunnus albacares]